MKLRIILLILLVLVSPFFAMAETKGLSDQLQIHFFYSPTCLHCIAEQSFLDVIEKEYPNLEISRYDATWQRNQKRLLEMAEKYNIDRYTGIVPLTFIGEDYFLGFDNGAGTGAKIRTSIERQMSSAHTTPVINNPKNIISLPFVGELDASEYSFLALAAILGILDGFNVCSLGALVLILGLVLVLRSRKKILLYGGTYIITTAVIYGLLLSFWYKLFSALSQYLRSLEIVIGFIALMGGVYFLMQFYRFMKHGPACEMVGSKIVSKFTKKVQSSFQKTSSILAIIGSIFVFATVITIVEFPCSAAIPVVFTGILAKANLSLASYIFYICLFLLFYMLDELIVFSVAVSKMSLWLSSSRFIVWITLAEALLMFGLGVYYLGPHFF